MKILVVGGSGALGGHAAAFLSQRGHEVSIGARKPPSPATPMAKMPFVPIDYMAGNVTTESLAGFDGIVFAAGNDGRHAASSPDMDEHLRKAAAEAQPGFMRVARDAGVGRVVQLGSYYWQAEPTLEDDSFYIRTRRLACEAGRAEACPGFDVISINPPMMVGGVPGLPSVMMMDPPVAWAKGDLKAPLFAPPGCTNYMSYRSLSQAIEGALLRGESGNAYLVGDETLTYAEYAELFFKAVGNPVQLEVRDEPHPVLPAYIIGEGYELTYEPDPEEAALLGYARNDVANGVAEAVAVYEGMRTRAS